jgi:hypothetical protein
MATTSAGHYSTERARREGKIKMQKDQGLRRMGEQEGRVGGVLEDRQGVDFSTAAKARRRRRQ